MTGRLPYASALILVALAGAVLLDATPQRMKTRDNQTTAPATGFALGRVVDAATNRPIARATVTLVADETMPGPITRDAPRVLSDASGRFVFRGLAAGRHRFTATAPGYLEGGAGQERPGGVVRPFSIDAGQGIGDLTVRLWREATIAGAVADDGGGAVPGVWVTLLRREAGRTGGWAIRDAGGARTDDRGVYQIAGVHPGTYIVAVATRMMQSPPAGANRPAVRIGDVIVQTGGDGMWGPANVLAGMLPTIVRPDGRVVGYPTTYHPGATSLSSAIEVVVNAGDERSGVDVRLRRATLTRVSGSVVGPAGPEEGIEVVLTPEFAADQTLERTHGTLSTRSDATGAFTLIAVPAGRYRLRAWRRPPALVIGRDPLPADATLWSESTMEVGEELIEGLNVRLQRGTMLTGRIRFQGTAARPNPGQLQTGLSVAFQPPWSLAFGARMATRVSPAWEFQTEALPPGRYFANLPNNFTSSLAARGWHFESATHAGKDLTRTALVLDGQPVTDIEITFSDHRSRISGVVTDATGRPASTGVVVMPADYRGWIDDGLSPWATFTTVAGSRGDYELTIAPGEYLVAAVDDSVFSSWPDVAAIPAIAAAAAKVTVARGEQRRVDLRRR